MSLKVSFLTLGCKVNQNESAALQRMFAGAGFALALPGEAADVYVINSCTVTAQGDAKSRRLLNRARRENPAAITVLTGCYPQAFPRQALLLGANITTGTNGRARLCSHVKRFMETGQNIADIERYHEGAAFEELPAARQETADAGIFEQGRTRAFVKIEDGCNRRCSYCIIPTARGQIRSRDEAAILTELETLAQRGCREVVFTGINLPSYGRDKGTNLADIVEKACAVEGILRLRLSSLDPDLVDSQLVRRFSLVEKLCPQFHLSLQSGCDETLNRMRRPYNTGRFVAAARALRRQIPGATLTTDVIVGFPGETEEEFNLSLSFVKRMEFLKVHVFPYSRRPGTPAAEFPGQIPAEEKARRAKAMRDAAAEGRRKVIGANLGLSHRVLLEKPDSAGLFSGYTENYIPVKINAPHSAQGEIVEILLTAEMVAPAEPD